MYDKTINYKSSVKLDSNPGTEKPPGASGGLFLKLYAPVPLDYSWRCSFHYRGRRSLGQVSYGGSKGRRHNPLQTLDSEPREAKSRSKSPTFSLSKASKDFTSP